MPQDGLQALSRHGRCPLQMQCKGNAFSQQKRPIIRKINILRGLAGRLGTHKDNGTAAFSDKRTAILTFPLKKT